MSRILAELLWIAVCMAAGYGVAELVHQEEKREARQLSSRKAKETFRAELTVPPGANYPVTRGDSLTLEWHSRDRKVKAPLTRVTFQPTGTMHVRPGDRLILTGTLHASSVHSAGEGHVTEDADSVGWAT